MLEILRKLAGKPASAAELRVALGDVEDARERAEAALAEAKAAKRAAIVAGDEKAIAQADARITVAERDRERADVAGEDLARRADEAARLEAETALDVEVEAVVAEAGAVAKLLNNDYTRHANALVGILRRLDAAERAVEAINAKLHAAGRDDFVLPIEAQVFPPRGDLLHVSIRDATRLRPFLDNQERPIPGRPMGWPEQEAT